MIDWSGALAHAFQCHLTADDEGKQESPTAAFVGSSPAQTAPCTSGTTGTTRPEAVVPPVVPAKPTESLGFAAPGTTGTTGTTHFDADLQASWGDDQAALLAERAAIVEEGARVPRAWAEAFASLDLVARQHYPEAGARQLIDDAGWFLDRWGNEAARLGWSAVDVFGTERTSDVTAMPTGLVSVISGGVVESIGDDRATIRMSDGGIVVYLRRPRLGLSSDWERADGAAQPPGGRR